MTAHPLPAPGSGSPSGPGPLARLRDVAITHEGEDVATPARVSFDVAPGEVVLVLGPSGSGKSTLALAFNGLIPHAVPATLDGSVAIAGLETAASTVARLSRHVGMVFQDPDAQLVTGTLLDEVAFGPENLRLPVGDVLARAEAALRRVGLWERRAENPDRLSGGGRQRLAIACALAMGSRLMVLDEPTANLDPRGIDEVYEALAEIAGDPERAIVLIEHNLDAAVALVTRVVVLDAVGVVLLDGPTDAVLRGDAERLAALGVWLPTSTLAALRLRDAGYRFEPLPLTPAELRGALEAQPSPDPTPAVTADSATPASTPALADPAIEVRDLTLRRGKTPVLHDVTVAVPRGSFVAVVGANGAGKTTLVQAMAGVLPTPKGTVHVGGDDIARLDERTRAERVGFVFQNPEHQFITASVFEEIAHGLRRTAASEEDVHERTMALLERFGLAERAHVHPFLLSGGQKRRLSVGTALVAGAGILALDEPTFGQDRARAEELLALLGDLHDESTTIIVVTHDMQLVAEHAERVVVMAGGRILADATTAEVFADADLIYRAGLRMPPLTRALHGVMGHPRLASATRVADLPGAGAALTATPLPPGTDGIPS